jgi:6-pyruvoyltetrahydropterin/6-carboxytetrahydropterin synthase
MRIGHAFTFEAAHRLTNIAPDHKCYRMHGHSYRVELEFEGAIDQQTGFVIDFYEIERVFKPVIEQLDHHCLNEVEGLPLPSVENIAIWIWDHTKPLLPQLARVKLYETANCWAIYEGRL